MRCVPGLLVLCVPVLGLVSTLALGTEFAGGTGDPGDPYLVATCEQLIQIGQDPNLLDRHFAMVEDLDMDPNSPGGCIFTQAVIAPDTDPEHDDFQGMVFTGSFDGRGHAIRHLTIHSDEGDFLGLFGRVGKKAMIRDLALENVRIGSSGYCLAGLVAFSRGCISHCRVAGQISGSGEWCSCLGLLAGRAWGRIDRCDAEGTIDCASVSRGGYFGLLVGQNSAHITDCTSAGAITGGEMCYVVGGLVGDNLGSIADCRSECHMIMHSMCGGTGRYGGLVGSNGGPICRSRAIGDISCRKYSKYVGGLAGYSSGVVQACYADVEISGECAVNYFGGLAGINCGHLTHAYARGNVTASLGVGGLAGENWGNINQCYATGQAVADKESWIPVGGLVGDGRMGRTTSSFWDVQTSGIAGSEGGTGLGTLNMQSAEVFLNAGWDFVQERANGTADVWSMPKDGGYPTLAVFSDGCQPHPLEGSGTPDDPYRIATAEDLGAICRHDITACYCCTHDFPEISGIIAADRFRTTRTVCRAGQAM